MEEVIDNNQLNFIFNAVNNYNPFVRLGLYRGLHYFEEQEAYNSLINEAINTVILFDIRMNNRYYFGKFNGGIYHIITDGELNVVRCVRLIDQVNLS
jgi:hypothetical protein